jgi:hypothetical protein
MKSVLIIGLLAVTTAQQSSVSRPSKVYLLHDDKRNAWCGYSDEKLWRKSVDEIEATQVASVEFVGGHPIVIRVTTEDDPGVGDWAAYETYELSQTGKVVSLERITNFLPNDAKRTEIFQRREGKLVRTGLSIKSLRSGRPTSAPDIWFLKFPLFETASALPFSSLIDHAQEFVGPNTHCVPTKESQPLAQ